MKVELQDNARRRKGGYIEIQLETRPATFAEKQDTMLATADKTEVPNKILQKGKSVVPASRKIGIDAIIRRARRRSTTVLQVARVNVTEERNVRDT